MKNKRIITCGVLVCQAICSFILGVLIVLALLGGESLSPLLTHFGKSDIADISTFAATASLGGNYRWETLFLKTASEKKSIATQILSETNVGSTSGNFVLVDLSEQREYVFYEADVFMYRIATGSVLAPIPQGIWKITEYMEGSQLGPLYGPCLFMLAYYDNGTWIETTRALHGTNTPDIIGVPETLGCVYHYNEDILEVCDMLVIGDLVVVTE